MSDVCRLVWTELPLIAMVNLLVTVAGSVVVVLAMTVAPLAPLAAAGLLGPVWIGAVAVAARLLAGEAVGMRELVREIRGRARTGIGIALVPAVVATLLIGTAGLLTVAGEQRWLLLPIAVDATALVVLALGTFYAVPLAVLTGLRGRERWLAALALAGRELTATLGMAAIVVLLALSIPYLGPFLLLFAAAPLALLSTAVTRAAIAELAPPGQRHD